jgi:hypothetical protein
VVGVKVIRFCFIAIMVAVIGIVAGCSSRTAQDTKESALPRVGIIDMQTAIKAHPQYAALTLAKQEYNTLAAEVAAEREGAAMSNLPAPIDGLDGLQAAASQEFNAKMAAKENEVKTQLGVAADQVRKSTEAELDAYVRELDKVYQPQIFNIQLKIKTVQLSKEETAALQTELDRLQNERAAKITARQQELAHKMDDIMAAKHAEAKRQLDAYGQELQASIATRLAGQQTELAARATATRPASGVRTEKEQQLAMKNQEITVLQDSIINDIRDKVAKVAAENKLDTVLTEVRVNVNASDITTAVIAEFNK